MDKIEEIAEYAFLKTFEPDKYYQKISKLPPKRQYRDYAFSIVFNLMNYGGLKEELRIFGKIVTIESSEELFEQDFNAFTNFIRNNPNFYNLKKEEINNLLKLAYLATPKKRKIEIILKSFLNELKIYDKKIEKERKTLDEIINNGDLENKILEEILKLVRFSARRSAS